MLQIAKLLTADLSVRKADLSVRTYQFAKRTYQFAGLLGDFKFPRQDFRAPALLNPGSSSSTEQQRRAQFGLMIRHKYGHQKCVNGLSQAFVRSFLRASTIPTQLQMELRESILRVLCLIALHVRNIELARTLRILEEMNHHLSVGFLTSNRLNGVAQDVNSAKQPATNYTTTSRASVDCLLHANFLGGSVDQHQCAIQPSGPMVMNLGGDR